MLLRNFSSCRFLVSSLSITGKSNNLGDSLSSYFLLQCPCRNLDQPQRGFSDKLRDPKDFTRYAGRPDDPPNNTGKWKGRPAGPCDQKKTDTSQASELKTPSKWTGRPEETCGDYKKSSRLVPEDTKKPRRWTDRPEDTNRPGKRCRTESSMKTGRPDDRNGKRHGRPEETCDYSGKQNQNNSLTSPPKSSDSSASTKSYESSPSGKDLGNTKASFAAASFPNISTPIHSAIVNVEMSEATELLPPDSLASPSKIPEVPPQNQILPSSKSECLNVDAKHTEKVIAIQDVVSAQLGGVLGQPKTGVDHHLDSFKSNNVGPALVVSRPVENSANSQKIGGWFSEQYVDVMSQRSSLRPTRVSPEKLSIPFPAETEQLEPQARSPEPQIPDLKRPVGSKTSLDVKIPGSPKLKVVKDTYNEKRRHRIYSFGLSETGALGLYKPSEGRRWRKFISRPLRHQFAEETRVISAESGYGFTLFYVNSETNVKLYGCGINTDFQLGPTDAEVITYPSPIDIHINSKKTKIVSFSAGRAHSAVATDNEGVFLFGSNSYGQCGRTFDEEDKTGPACTITQIKNFAGEKSVGVCCGQDHTCFITVSGKVYSCGWGAEGQTGLGHSSHSYEPCLVQGDIKGENIVKITGKCDTVLALNEKGELFGWGSNEFRQIIDDKDLPQVESPVRMQHVNKICGKIVDVAAGSSFCLVLNHEGDVYVWGYGILGGGPELDRTTVPTLLPRTLFGTNEYQPKVIPLRVYCGLDHMAVMNSLNHVYSWGKNKHGCLGIGISRDQYFPYKLSISANAVHVTCAVDHSVIVTDHS